MISRPSNEFTRTSNILDRIAAVIDLRSRVFNPTDDVTLFPFDEIEVWSAAQVRAYDGLDVPADMLKTPSNRIEISAAAMVYRFDAQRIPDDVLVMRSSVLASPSASRGVTLDLRVRPAAVLSCTAAAMNRTPDVLESSFDVQWIPADVMRMRFDRTEIPAVFTVLPADILTIPTAVSPDLASRAVVTQATDMPKFGRSTASDYNAVSRVTRADVGAAP